MKEMLTKLGWKKAGFKKWKKNSAVVKLDRNSMSILKYDEVDRQVIDELYVAFVLSKRQKTTKINVDA